MAHEIWEDNMLYAGQMPWHGIGKQVPPDLDGESLKEMLNLSPVELRPVFTWANGGYEKISNRRAVVRTKEETVLGVVGEEFTPVQDIDIIDMMEVLRREGLTAFETAGLLRDGSRFFMMLHIPNGTLKLKTPNGKEDVICNYLGVSHAHDGTLALEFTPTNVRVVCANTLAAASAEASRNRVSFYIKHTTNADARIKAAIGAYKQVIQFNSRFAQLAEQLVATPFGAQETRKLLENLFPSKDEKDVPGATLKQRFEVSNLILTGAGHEHLGIVGTAWGAYNAVCEYLDWNRPTRGDKELTTGEKRAKMWQASQFTNQVNDKKLAALSLIGQIAGINVVA